MNDRKKVIVTGATSFIGQSLIRSLINQGYYVIALIRPNSIRKNLLCVSDKIKIVETELEQLESLDENVLLGCNSIYHIGWCSDFENPRYNLEGQMKNVRVLQNVIELSKRIECKKIISVGSQAECGRVNKAIDENTPDNPETAYAVAKCLAYNRGMELCEKYNINLYWPRLLSAYGPNDKGRTMIMSCLEACIYKKKIDLTMCEQIWDYIYVDDAAEALISIVKQGTSGIKYPIASGEGKPLKEFIKKISLITGNNEIMQRIGMKEYSENQVMYLVGNIDRLQKDTGFMPKVSFEQGIINTIKSNFR